MTVVCENLIRVEMRASAVRTREEGNCGYDRVGITTSVLGVETSYKMSFGSQQPS